MSECQIPSKSVADFLLHRSDDFTEVQQAISSKFHQSKLFKTVRITAYDSLIDEACQLAISVKATLQHGLHQTTHMFLEPQAGASLPSKSTGSCFERF